MLLIFRFFKSSFSKTKLCRKEIYPIYIFLYYFPILFSLRYFFHAKLSLFELYHRFEETLYISWKGERRKLMILFRLISRINLTFAILFSKFRCTLSISFIISISAFVSLNEWMVDVDMCKLKNWYIKNCKIKLGN